MKCGADPRVHRNYCMHCGEQLNPNQVVCIKCGTPIETKQKKSNDNFSSQNKDQIVAAILAFLLGGCGVHKYYLGDKVAAIYYLLLTFLGFFMLYAFANLYTIANYGHIDDFGDLGPGYLFFLIAWGMPIIDGIYILSLTPGEFAMKYNKND